MYLFKRNGIFYVEYFDETLNQPKRISTGKKKKTEATQFISKLEEVLAGKEKPAVITLSAFHSKYLQFVKDNLSPNYSRIVDLAFRQLEAFTGNVALDRLHYLQLEKFITESFKRTKEGTRTTYIALKSAFNKAKAWGYLDANHFEKIKLPKIPKNNPLFIKEEEFSTLLKYEPNPLLRDIYCFGFYTGLRLSEIVNLRWNEIDLADDIIRVRNTESFTTKSKRERVVPINNAVKSTLTMRIPKIISLANNNYVFLKGGVKINGDYITKGFKGCIRRSELNKSLHFHNLRHSFASNLASRGVSIFIIKELLGHQDVKTTQIYSHLRPDDLKSAVGLLNN